LTLIAHDPGHGYGDDRGASGNGITESDLVLRIADDIMNGIPWCQHQMLRRTLIGPSYTDRALAAAQMRPSVVLCHHINADPDPNCRGTITFYDAGDDLGKATAEAISQAAPGALLRHVNGVFACSPNDWTSRAHWVIDHYRKQGLSCCLIEWGFCTSPHDAAILLNPLCRPGIVTAAAAGIARAMELTADPNLACAPKEPTP
jgi:N-acetylmuramoyl-L-alanine amidase